MWHVKKKQNRFKENSKLLKLLKQKAFAIKLQKQCFWLKKAQGFKKKKNK